MSGFNYEEFDQMVGRVERLGADMDRVSKDVLNAGCEPEGRLLQRKYLMIPRHQGTSEDMNMLEKTSFLPERRNQDLAANTE